MHTGHASVQYHAAHVCTSLLSKHCWSALNPHLQAAALSLSLLLPAPLSRCLEWQTNDNSELQIHTWSLIISPWVFNSELSLNV